MKDRSTISGFSPRSMRARVMGDEDQGEPSLRSLHHPDSLKGGDQDRYHFTIIASTINVVPAKRNFSGRVMYFGHLKTP